MTGAAPHGPRFNGQWWADVMVRRTIIAQLRTYEDCVLNRILRSFDTLQDEVSAKSDALFESVELQPDADPSGAAEFASEEAFNWGADVGAVYMGTVALLTAGLFHLFEQHRDMFFREAQRIEARSHTDFAKWLRSVGVDIEEFPRWENLNKELRAVANVVKHAEGRSAVDLRRLRPDLFTLPSDRPGGSPFGLDLPVEGPLTGDGLYITEEDFTAYAALLRDFWEWLAERLESAAEAD